MPPIPQNIADQRERLAHHRQNVQTLLQQIAVQGGWIHAPLALLNTLSENRVQIARCKVALLGWREAVEHHPDDEAEGSVGALEQEIRELEETRSVPLAPAVRRGIKQALASAQERRNALHVNVSVQASGQARVYQAGRDLVVHEAPADRQAQQAERALTDYLRAVRSTSGALQLSRIDAEEARFSKAMRLEQVYIRLNTERQVELTQVETSAKHRLQEPRSLAALEALSTPAARLLLLGPPGSGKSTFVNHLALCLAGAVLCQRHTDERQAAEGWLGCLAGWPHGALLPVRVVLRELAAFVPLAQAPQGTIELLLAFLRAALGAHAAAIELLAQALSDGQAILLFDGLDEVVGEPILTRVVECIDAAAGTFTLCPVLVTCRVLDYQANPRRHLRGFTVETLAALDKEQINQFIDAWYAELTATGRQVLGKASALHQAVATRSELAALARLPLLLTMMAIVHAGKGILPDARALLYAECVELLLLRWRQEPGQKEILEQLELPQFRSTDLLALMARLGYEAHRQSERWLDDDYPADLTLDQVRTLLEEGFAPYAPYDELRRDRLVSLVLWAIATRNGLLLKQSGEQGEVYTFPHRTFQEFLAGYHIKGQQRDYLQRALGHAAQPHWHEALTLMVGYQVLAERELERPLMLVKHLLEQGVHQQILAGKLLALIGCERAKEYDPALTQPSGLWHRACDVLLRLSIQGRAPEVPALVRIQAGMVLGTLCYGSMLALCQGLPAQLPDSRLPLVVLGPGIAHSEGWRQALDSYWCQIKPGLFWSGDDIKRKPLRSSLKRVQLFHTYSIGRFPITNADFARFVAIGGYREPHWWGEYGWNWRLSAGCSHQPLEEPSINDLSGFNNPIQPIVGVSWYEATAYCTWLTELGYIQGWLHPSDVIRLPMALERERAARGTDQRIYPWGDAVPDSEHANYNETCVGQSSPVGCFVAGQSACGAFDMAGNVWEWTATSMGNPQSVQPVADLPPDRGILISGAPFHSSNRKLYCGARYWYAPYNQRSDIGFRVVCSPRLVKDFLVVNSSS